MSIHNFERRYHLLIEGPKGIKQSTEALPGNKKTILEFTTYLEATGKSLPRKIKLLFTLKKLAELLGPISFKEATKKDLVNVLAKVKGSDHTRSDFQKITKLFYAWLYDVEDPRQAFASHLNHQSLCQLLYVLED